MPFAWRLFREEKRNCQCGFDFMKRKFEQVWEKFGKRNGALRLEAYNSRLQRSCQRASVGAAEKSLSFRYMPSEGLKNILPIPKEKTLPKPFCARPRPSALWQRHSLSPLITHMRNFWQSNVWVIRYHCVHVVEGKNLFPSSLLCSLAGLIIKLM